MEGRGVFATTNITHIVRTIDRGKMVKPQYEAIANLSLLVAFVAFVALYHPTIGKE